MPYPLVWIIIGVAGCGKTTIGRRLAERLDCDFIEGDRRHSFANITRMRAGTGLSDSDRAAWLADLHDEARNASAAGRELVISCSALRRSYRDQLASAGRVQMVLPVVPEAVLLARLETRNDHYMSKAMLTGQIQTFERPSPDEDVWEVDGMLDPTGIIGHVIDRARQQWPGLRETWWRRS